MMKRNAEIQVTNEGFQIAGDLHFSNVMQIYHKSLTYFADLKNLQFDLSQVKSCDSSGLALLLDWMKYASKNQKTIRFTRVSDSIMSIAKAAGLDKVLSLES